MDRARHLCWGVLVTAVLCSSCSVSDAEDQRRRTDEEQAQRQGAALDREWAQMSSVERERLCTKYRADLPAVKREYGRQGYAPRIISAWLVSHC